MATPTVQGAEIEITPEMIEAGADIIWRQFYDVMPRGSDTGRVAAREVYRAMQSASGRRKFAKPNEGS
jgi:hypothetical protein